MWDKILFQNPQNRIKARLGFCPIRKLKTNIEISDDFGFSQIFESLTKASRDCGISNPSALKYALDNGKPEIKRRSDKKIFYIREINWFFE